MKTRKSKSWKYAAAPCLIVVFLALYPQLSFWVAKGSAWEGSYYASNYDEVAYSAYINGLINGKPRKYDPFIAAETAGESFYSAQFIPAYTIALPARFLGLSVSEAFNILICLTAIFSSLAIFWLLYELTGDKLLSGVGVLIVTCLGTAAAFQGELRSITSGDLVVDYLPFLRRYQPGFAFPIFFLFCASVWRALGALSRKRAVTYSLLAALALSVLIFSYFYLWTAAAAWIVVWGLINLIWNRTSRANALLVLSIVGSVGIVVLIPYFMLLSSRSESLDAVQLLSSTHAPDLKSASLIIGVLIAGAIAVLVRRGTLRIGSSRVLFALSLAVTPIVLFNQQIVTGRSLQPVHYEIFISNYLVLTSLVMVVSLAFPRSVDVRSTAIFKRAVVCAALVAVSWGFIEAWRSTERSTLLAELRDQSIPAIKHIERDDDPQRHYRGGSVLFTNNLAAADFIPTVALLRPLWNSHSSSGGGVDIAENKRLFYCYLFYSGFAQKDLAASLTSGSFEVTAAIFGSERALPALGQNSTPITPEEIDAEALAYAQYVNGFSKDEASNPTLSYLMFPEEGEPDFENLDKWYERDQGLKIGLFRVYKVKLRQ